MTPVRAALRRVRRAGWLVAPLLLLVVGCVAPVSPAQAPPGDAGAEASTGPGPRPSASSQSSPEVTPSSPEATPAPAVPRQAPDATPPRQSDEADGAREPDEPLDPVDVSGPRAVVVRSVGALPAGLPEQLAGLSPTTSVAAVRAGQVSLVASRDAAGATVDRPDPGWSLPLDAVGVDPAAYAEVVPAAQRDALGALTPGRVLLSTTSARVRRLDAGARLELGGAAGPLEVGGVVDDRLVGTAELVVHAADADAVGLGGVRYAVVVDPGGQEALLGDAVTSAVAGIPRVLATDVGPWPWAASWREVLPQAAVKERFGEFALRYGAGRAMAQEPGWADANVVTATVPILGAVRCHQAIVEPLRAALSELEERGLAELVDAGDYAGCFSPRAIGPGAGPSRHAWGLAVDLNASRNPFGAPSTQDPRLVEVMGRHGFGFGGDWPVPDAMHFEYRGDAGLSPG